MGARQADFSPGAAAHHSHSARANTNIVFFLPFSFPLQKWTSLARVETGTRKRQPKLFKNKSKTLKFINLWKPLFNHVRTFYIVRYTSSTTNPSQPTYSFDELQKKRGKKPKKRKPGRGKKIIITQQTTHNNNSNNNIYNNNHSNSQIRYKHTHTPLQNNIHMFKVHCGSAVWFGRAFLGFPITAHYSCAFLM